MPFSCSLWKWKIGVLGMVYAYFWVDFENEHKPKKAYNTWSLSMYVVSIKALHFFIRVWCWIGKGLGGEERWQRRPSHELRWHSLLAWAQIEVSCQPQRRSFSRFSLRWSPAAFWNLWGTSTRLFMGNMWERSANREWRKNRFLVWSCLCYA